MPLSHSETWKSSKIFLENFLQEFGMRFGNVEGVDGRSKAWKGFGAK
jgi:hypothetical protein